MTNSGKLPAAAGWHWVRRGFALFRQRPFELCAMFLGYLFLMLMTRFIPVIGQLISLLLIPVFSMAFMQACANIDHGIPLEPGILLSGFRSSALGKLLKLGTLYIVATAAAIAASNVIDDGLLWKLVTRQITLTPKTAEEITLWPAVLFSAAIYLPALMAFWHAAPLIAWQDMRVSKAVFYSFFAVLRAGAAFLVYGLAWVAVTMFLSTLLGAFGTLFGQTLMMILVLPVSVVLTVVVYCSFYPAYTDIFGKPPLPKQ